MARGKCLFRTIAALNTETMSVDISIVAKENDEVVASRSYKAAEIHDSVKAQVGLYGLSKLLQDRASDVEVSPEKLDAMDDIAAQLAGGQWAKERKIGAVVTSPEVEALARLKKVSVPAAQAALKGYPKEQREKILANPAIVELAAKIREERSAAETISLDDLAG
jgi:hypothetical protein